MGRRLRSPVLIVTNLSPFEIRSNLVEAMDVYDAQVIDANGGSLQSTGARAVNRARIHMELWQRIAELEFGPTQWVVVIEETARVLHASLLDSLFEVQDTPMLESAGIIMLGTTQTSRVKPNVTGGVEILSEKSSALLQASALAYAVTPEFASRLYATNVNDPVAISHVLTDMYYATRLEPPRFFRMSFPPFDVSVPNKQTFDQRLPDSANILTNDNNSPKDSMELQDMPMSKTFLKKTKPQSPVSMASISESFYKRTAPPQKDRKDPSDLSSHERHPIRMQATRKSHAAVRSEFESELESDLASDLQSDSGEISRYASMTLVFLVVLIIVGYMVIRFVTRAPPDVWGGQAKERNVNYTPTTGSGEGMTTESIKSAIIEPVL